MPLDNYSFRVIVPRLMLDILGITPNLQRALCHMMDMRLSFLVFLKLESCKQLYLTYIFQCWQRVTRISHLLPLVCLITVVCMSLRALLKNTAMRMGSLSLSW